MGPERWEQIERLYHDALARDPDARAAFLDEACAGDGELRREVDALIACDDRAARFIEAPALEVAALALASEGPGAGRLGPGDRLGPYEIQALLGTGGMGEVYRGLDARLGRDVALKVISPRLVGDPSHRRRFETEARAASALNHPGIVTVYDVGERGELSWIAMEWVEGRTLREALSDGPLALREALSIMRQVADALAAAHGKGIVHRDLKPENVMLTAEGRSKILDFGLARRTLAESLGGPVSQVETQAAPPSDGTREGTILGTVGYMSPEQASGLPVDFRSDQFAFGLIAYEMLTGRRAFARLTAVETLSAVIREEPVPLSSLRSGVPPALRELIATCLAKRPEDRFPSTRELATALESLGTAPSTVPTEAPTETSITPPAKAAHPSRVPRRAVLGAALLLALGAVAWMRFNAFRGPIASLAVLPFASATHDPDSEVLGDGLAESLIDQMSRVPSLKVMARATVFRLKGTSDPQEAGRKLGVGAVVTGTVSRRGDRLSITAELVEIDTGIRLWGNRYERPFADLIRVQDSIASDIADALRLKLSAPERRTLGGHGTDDPEAYALSLRANQLLLKNTEEDDLEARRLYEQAVRVDPRFVEAHVGAATTYSRSAVSGWAPPAEAFARAQEELQKALDLEPGNVLARCLRANRSFFFDWDWARVDREYRELSHEPRLFHGQLWRPIGLYYWAVGRPEEGVALMERALGVDPGDVVSRRVMAHLLAEAGRLEPAVATYRACLEAEPSDPSSLLGLAEVLRRRDDMKGAIDALRKAYELSGDEPGTKALATARTDADYENAELAVARARLAALEPLAKERYVSPLEFARLYAQTGKGEKAFASLEAAIAERSPGLVFLKVERAWDRIRDDARFAPLVRRVGIP